MNRLRFFLAAVLLGLPHPGWASTKTTVDGSLLNFGTTDNLNLGQAAIRLDYLNAGFEPRQQSLTSLSEDKRLKLSTPLGKAFEQNYNILEAGNDFSSRLCIDRMRDTEAITLRVELENKSSNPVYIKSITLLDRAVIDAPGKAADWIISDALGSFANNLADLQNISTDYGLTIYNKTTARGLRIANVGTEGDLRCSLERDETNRLRLTLSVDMSSVIMPAGARRSSGNIILLYSDWKESAQHVGTWWNAQFGKGKLQSRYGIETWGGHGSSIDQKDVEQMVLQAKNQTWDTLLIEEGWQVGRHNWHPNANFANNMTALTKNISKAGLAPGIWISPIRADSLRIVGTEKRDFELYGGEVQQAFPDEWYLGNRAQTGPSATKTLLDPAFPATAQHINKAFSTAAKSGFTVFKSGYSVLADGPAYENYAPSLTRFQRQRRLFDGIRQAIGRRAYLIAGQAGQPRNVIGKADAIGLSNAPLPRFTLGTIDANGFPEKQVGLWTAILRMVATSPFNGYCYIGDPGSFYARPRTHLPCAHIQTFNSFVALYGGLAFCGDLPEALETDERRMLPLLSPVCREKGQPFAGGTDIFGRQFGSWYQRPWGSHCTLISWNPQHEATETLQIDNAPAELGERFHAYSFWDDRYLGVIDRAQSFPDAAPYSSKLLRLTPLAKGPQLIGSNLHLSMGACEIRRMKVSGKAIGIELDSAAGANSGRLIFYSEEPLQLNKFNGMENCFLVRCADNVYTLVLENRNPDDRQRITLIKGPNAMALELLDPESSAKKAWDNSSFAQP